MKNFYFLALLLAMLLFACTADGVFDGDPSNVQWSKDVSSSGNGAAVPSSSSIGDDPYGSCTFYDGCYNYYTRDECEYYDGIFSPAPCPSSSSSSNPSSSSSSNQSDPTGSCILLSGSCREGVSQGSCSGTFSSGGLCNIETYMYCAYGNSYNKYCDLIGGHWIENKDWCLLEEGGFFATLAYCNSNGYEVDDY
jgi:hypothetical protein